MKLDYAHPQLRREVGLPGAVMLGLGSILGTGVFVSLPLKTAEAGLWIIPAIVIAGLVALCNALSSAQLAAAHPVSGGTYEYGYQYLNPWAGFVAGWTFLLAKSASAATAALAVGAFALAVVDAQPLTPPSDSVRGLASVFWTTTRAPLVLALPGTIAVMLLVLTGLRRSSAANAVLVTMSVLGLSTLIAVSYVSRTLQMPITERSWPGGGPDSILPLAAWAFVAFTGYGRIATMAEEVRSPRRTIPRAVYATLGISLILYVCLAIAVMRSYYFTAMSGEGEPAPATAILYAVPVDLYYRSETAGRMLRLFVALSAIAAMLGVLLNLILGLSRVWLAMARRGDAPSILARINARTSTPGPAVVLTGLLIASLVLVGDVRLTWSFSAFTVLIYYAITNWAALRLPVDARLYPRWVAWCGLVACLSLAWFVEWRVWAVGVALIAVGLLWRVAWRKLVLRVKVKAA
ncbi:MAG: APC family permease [Tepidisphaeraceae bacterium]